jgi:hypothetical protein
MATQRGGAAPKRKAGVPAGDYPFPPVSMASAGPLKQNWELVMGWIAACVLIVALLPLLGMLYMDVLETKHEAKQQIEKMEKLRREIEKEKRDDSNSRIPPR